MPTTHERFPLHPAAELMPRPTPDEVAEIEKDIQLHGQVDPISIYQGQVLDGVTRQELCIKLGLPIKYEEIDCESPTDFAVSKNVRRRMLSVAQKSLIASQVVQLYKEAAKRRQVSTLKMGTVRPAPFLSAERNGKTATGEAVEQAAHAMGVSKASVYRAKRIQELGSQELREKVRKGEVSLRAAEASLPRSSKPERRREPNKAAPKPPRSLRERKLKHLGLREVVLEFVKLLSYEAFRSAYLKAASEFHPDRGGSAEKMAELNVLWGRIEEEVYAK